MDERARRETLRERAAALLDLPGDTVVGLPTLKLVGDKEVRMENYRGVLSCEREEIHVDGGRWTLRLRGEKLEIRVMREGELLITGLVTGIELL